MVARCLEVTVGPTASLKENKASTNKVDPYAVLKLGDVEKRTDAEDGAGARPVWNHRFNFLLPDAEEDYPSELLVQIWEKVDSEDKYLGACRVQLPQVYKKASMDVVQPVHQKSGKLLGHLRFHFSVLVEDIEADRAPTPPLPSPVLVPRSSPSPRGSPSLGSSLKMPLLQLPVSSGDSPRPAATCASPQQQDGALAEILSALEQALSSPDTLTAESLAQDLSRALDQQRMPPPKLYQPQPVRHASLSSQTEASPALSAALECSAKSNISRPPPLDLSTIRKQSSLPGLVSPSSSSALLDDQTLASLLSPAFFSPGSTTGRSFPPQQQFQFLPPLCDVDTDKLTADRQNSFDFASLFSTSSFPSVSMPEPAADRNPGASGMQNWDVSAISSLASAVLSCTGNDGPAPSDDSITEEAIAEALSAALGVAAGKSPLEQDWDSAPYHSKQNFNKLHLGPMQGSRTSAFTHTSPSKSAPGRSLKRLTTEELISELLVTPKGGHESIFKEPKRHKTLA